MYVIVVQTKTFRKQVKKIHKNQKKELDNAVKKIVKDPFLGDAKKGDLQAVRIYKFSMNHQLTLLAYEYNTSTKELLLLSLGVHENFYRDLKKQIH
jgi:mRNA-degrading endonuclease YafQ of YafQ-DinJ toxin-antitoxin module